MKLLLIGGGGHCRSIIDSLDRAKFNRIGIVDQSENVGKTVLGLEIIGSDAQLATLFKDGFKHCIIAFGSTGDTTKKRQQEKLLSDYGFSFVRVTDFTAVVSIDTKIGIGTFTAKSAVINTGSVIGNHAIINTNSSIDHDCTIGNFVHVAPGCTLSGGVSVGDDTHIGTGSSIINSISIGKNSMIGAGSVVINDIPDNVVAFGNPCKIIRKR